MSTGSRSTEVLALAVLFVAITVFTVVGFAHDWKPPVASEEGVRVDSLIRYLLLATGTVLVVGAAAMVGFLWRYGRGATSPAPRSDPRLERWWSLVPVLGMAVIADMHLRLARAALILSVVLATFVTAAALFFLLVPEAISLPKANP
jgi:heme/copper-type cytochrome/quinol oxidase subunit 2